MVKTSSTGQYYENFPNYRFFLNKGEDRVTLKRYQVYKGKMINCSGWLCLSWRSGKPILYDFVGSYGIRNITYQSEFDLIFKEFLREVPYCSVKSFGKTSRKKKSLTKKFIKLISSFFPNCQSLEETNMRTLKCWFPILKDELFTDEIIKSLIPTLQHKRLRKGLSTANNLKEAVKRWFGIAPKGLVRRISQIIAQKQSSSLVLAVSCRNWNLDCLYSLIDTNHFWDNEINIEEATLLLDSYSEKRWLKMFSSINFDDSHFYEYYFLLEDAIRMFLAIREEPNYILPSHPRSWKELHDGLAKDSGKIKSYKLKDLILPESTLDGQEIGNFILSTPKTGSDLIDWGEELDNCLASYITQVHAQECSVLGIFENKQLKYALSLHNLGLGQFYGRSNTLPEPKDKELIENFLKSQRIKR